MEAAFTLVDNMYNDNLELLAPSSPSISVLDFEDFVDDLSENLSDECDLNFLNISQNVFIEKGEVG
jgi:hypothetical protein